MYKLLGITLSVLFLSAGSVSAETILRTGDTVSIAEGQAVVGDFYSLASIINISGRVEGDVVAAAGRFTVNGEVADDVLVLGGSVDVHGPVGDDVRVIGGEVVIAEPVEGSVFVLGGTVSILSTAAVGGDVLVYGGDVEILGPVTGDVLGGFNSLRIDSVIEGEVNVTTETLRLGDNANIAGTLSYVSANLVERSPNAIVTGEILRNDTVESNSVRDQVQQYISASLVLAFAVLAWYLLSRGSLLRVTNQATVYSPRAGLFGFGVLVITPVVVGILLTSVLGSLLGLILLFTYILVVLTAVMATPVVIGRIVEKIANQKATTASLATISIGLVVTALLPLLPIIGPVLILATIIVCVGAMAELLFQANKK